MPSADCDLNGATDGVLTLDLREIDALLFGRSLEETALPAGKRVNQFLVVKEAHRFVEAGDGVNVHTLHECGLIGRFSRDNEATFAQALGQHGHGKRTFNGAGLAR